MSNHDRFTPVRLETGVIHITCAETNCANFCQGSQAIGHVLRDGSYPLARINNCGANRRGANDRGKYPILDEAKSACNRFMPTE